MKQLGCIGLIVIIAIALFVILNYCSVVLINKNSQEK